jgi:hypothetical protein
VRRRTSIRPERDNRTGIAPYWRNDRMRGEAFFGLFRPTTFLLAFVLVPAIVVSLNRFAVSP